MLQPSDTSPREPMHSPNTRRNSIGSAITSWSSAARVSSTPVVAARLPTMRLRLLPAEASPDAGLLLATRAMRAFVDGLVAVVLPSYLIVLGLTGQQIGVVLTATLLGSAVLTLFVGLRAYRLPRRFVLRLAAATMVATGIGFGLLSSFWALTLVALAGTLNPSAGDVSIFLPTEQSLLAQTVSDRQRTALYARYSLIGFVCAAVGSLAAGLPDAMARATSLSETTTLRLVFGLYAVTGVLVFGLYRHLSPQLEPADRPPAVPLGPTRRLVYRLAATFSLDAFGGGFVVQSLLAFWLFRRFDLSIGTAGAIFFWAGLLSGASALIAVRIAHRIGLIRTMVFTHLPANLLLMATPFMPNLLLATACLLARSALSQMDVPTRTSYVMAVVTPAERPAAASITNVPRSLAAAIAPLAAGWLLDQSTFGWPLLIGGALKTIYDLLLLVMFRHIRPPEEQ